jgi:mannose-6-phosphate isomerase-like protein (cupin superfamily)
VYYVISGSGTFILKGKKIKVRKTDVVIVPKNTPYDYSGRMELFLVHLPAYNQKYETALG